MDDVIISVDDGIFEPSEPHSGKLITRLEVSPNGEYVVTYSEDDHSIIGWDAKDIAGKTKEYLDEGRLKPDITVEINSKYKIIHMCVSDVKKFVCIYTYGDRNFLKIIDMNNVDRPIELYFSRGLYPYDCAFDLENDFILCANVYDNDTREKKLNEDDIDHYIWTYSTKTKNNKWSCKGIYKVPGDFEIISISDDNKLHLLSNGFIYEWNILTGNMVRSIFLNEKKDNDEKEEKEKKKKIEIVKEKKKKKKYEEEETKEKEVDYQEDAVDKFVEGIAGNDWFICLRIKDKIREESDDNVSSGKSEDKIKDESKDKLKDKLKDTVTIYSTVLGIPVASLDINDDTQLHQLYNLMNHPGLYHLLPLYLPTLFKDEHWKKCLNERKLLSKEENHTEDLPIIQTTEKHVFGVLDGYVRKFRFEGRAIFPNEEDRDDNDEIDKDACETYEHLNIHLFTDMDTSLNQELVSFIWKTMMGYDDEVLDSNEKVNVDDGKEFIHIKVTTKDENLPIKVPLIGVNANFIDFNVKIKDDKQEFIYIKVDLTNNKNEIIKAIDMIIHVPIIEGEEDDINHKKHNMIDRAIKVPMEVLMDGEFDEEVEEFIYVKVQKNEVTNTLIDDIKETTSPLIDDCKSIVKIKINNNRRRLELQVFEKVNVINEWKWNLIGSKVERLNYHEYGISILGIKMLDNDDIAIFTTIGFFIYYFNENSKNISLNYFYSIDPQHMVEYYKKMIKSQSTLPTPNYSSFKFDAWTSYLKDNKECLLKYGVELMTFAIKEHKLELVHEIYEKCMKYFRDDVNNRRFLSIITSTMPLLEEYYPEFILRFSSATNMIIDSPTFNVEYRNADLHLYSFFHQDSRILAQSILWTKLSYKFYEFQQNHKEYIKILKAIQLVFSPLTLPLFIFNYIFSDYHFINDIYRSNLFSMFYYYINEMSLNSDNKLTPTITFMVPYIKFINYPQEYSWFMDWIRPQSSPFIKTMHSIEIYKTWNGEALINFKWNSYGKYYYYAIWIGFLALLLCFSIAATVPQEYLDENSRRILIIASVILGIIHLTFEIRQFIYAPIKWVQDSWNYIDVVVYVLPTLTSIYWLKTNDINERTGLVANLLACSCLFLDLKLLLFFRVYKSYGRYFAITISVAKKVYIFLIVFLTIIMMSFAHAFHILLSPKKPYSFDGPDPNNDDPNNPWQLTSSYAVLNDDNTSAGLHIVEEPDENTNLFADYRTALFAMSLFLTGDLGALSNWKFKDNPTIVVLVIFFTFLTVIYLLNVFIGLFTEVIQDDSLEASQLILKVEMLAEIELFYLLPHQRRRKEWFPDVLYYHANVDETREKVQAMKYNKKDFPKMRRALLKKLNIKPPDNHENILQGLFKKFLKSQEQD